MYEGSLPEGWHEILVFGIPLLIGPSLRLLQARLSSAEPQPEPNACLLPVLEDIS